jgi:cell division protein FtsB
MASVHQEIGEEIMGWIACCVLIAFLLPLGAMLYMDILEAKHEVKEQTEKIEKLRRQVEKDKRSNENGKT